MARYTGATCKLCRREGMKLFLKGDRCYSDKCAVTRRAYAPGQHGQNNRRKLSEYGLQLREKQKAKRFYGVLESQFERYFEVSNAMHGATGENLLAILESRLDNVVYRAGFAVSRPDARQLVSHAHFTVNGKSVNIPSYLLKAGDVVAVRESSRSNDKFKTVLESTGAKVSPAWLEVDHDKFQAKMATAPTRDTVDLQVEEHLIVELYSK